MKKHNLISQGVTVMGFLKNNKTAYFCKFIACGIVSILFLGAHTVSAFSCEETATKTTCNGSLYDANHSANSGDGASFNVGSNGILYFGATYKQKLYTCVFSSTQSGYFRNVALVENRSVAWTISIVDGKCSGWFINGSFLLN